MARFSSTQQQPPRDTLYWKVFSLDLTIMERKSISEIKKKKKTPLLWEETPNRTRIKEVGPSVATSWGYSWTQVHRGG